MRSPDDMHQCPYCELKFMYANEVKEHILNDHVDHENVALSADIHELPR
jgi:hypothetical protein